jgi:hypothetical protein
MDESEFISYQEEVRLLFNNERYEEAEAILQKCIDAFRVKSREFMETLLDEYEDQNVKDTLVHLYFWNYI